MIYAIIAGCCVILTSVFGSVLGLIFRKITHRINDMFLGFAAGVMMAAAFLGLLPTAFSQSEFSAISVAVFGIIAGAVFISLLDRFIPHIHIDGGQMREESSPNPKANRTLLLVIAIAIHNIPEGLATGIVFGKGVSGNALMVAASMMIQKIPEGLIVMIPLLRMGMSKTRALLFSFGVALMMLPGVVIGAILGSLPVMLEILFYGFTFGAIIYVVSDEIIPESHEHGYQRYATFALIVGIITVAMMQYI